MDRKSAIREFLQDLLKTNGDTRPLIDGESLLAGGRLQSIDAVEIVIFLEQRFGINFSDIGFDRDAIDSVNAIEALIEAHS